MYNFTYQPPTYNFDYNSWQRDYNEYVFKAVARENGFQVGNIKEIRRYTNCFLVIFYKGRSKFVSFKNILTESEYNSVRQVVSEYSANWSIYQVSDFNTCSSFVVIRPDDAVNISVVVERNNNKCYSNFGIDFRDYEYTSNNFVRMTEVAITVSYKRDKKIKQLLNAC